jgi:hypothetical protein
VRPQDRPSQPKKADGPPILSILKALLFSSILPPILLELAMKNLEYPAPKRHGEGGLVAPSCPPEYYNTLN